MPLSFKWNADDRRCWGTALHKNELNTWNFVCTYGSWLMWQSFQRLLHCNETTYQPGGKTCILMLPGRTRWHCGSPVRPFQVAMAFFQAVNRLLPVGLGVSYSSVLHVSLMLRSIFVLKQFFQMRSKALFTRHWRGQMSLYVFPSSRFMTSFKAAVRQFSTRILRHSRNLIARQQSYILVERLYPTNGLFSHKHYDICPIFNLCFSFEPHERPSWRHNRFWDQQHLYGPFDSCICV